jgi:aminoglycoside phosphotransferase (APT) family kinase protein
MANEFFDSTVDSLKAGRGDAAAQDWPARLAPFLRATLPASEVAIRDIRQAASGGSAGTLIFTADVDGVARDMVMRFSPTGGLFHSYDIPGQYRIQQALRGSGVPVPPLHGLDATGEQLGVPGYVMGFVDGRVPPSGYVGSGVLFDSTVPERARMAREVVSTLATLHRFDWRRADLDFLLKRGTGATAIERNLSWYWDAVTWAVPAETETLAPARDWLLANQPEERTVVLNQGDTQLGNYMFRDTELVAALDWEMSYLGPPGADIGYLAFTNEVLSLGNTPLPGLPRGQEWRALYEEIAGTELADWNYLYAMGIYMIHVAMLLVFRNVPDELAAAGKQVCAFTWESLNQAMRASD